MGHILGQPYEATGATGRAVSHEVMDGVSYPNFQRTACALHGTACTACSHRRGWLIRPHLHTYDLYDLSSPGDLDLSGLIYYRSV